MKEKEKRKKTEAQKGNCGKRVRNRQDVLGLRGQGFMST